MRLGQIELLAAPAPADQLQIEQHVGLVVVCFVKECANLSGDIECSFVAGELIPFDQPDHDVIVVPRVPAVTRAALTRSGTRQLMIFRPWPQIAIVLLQADESLHEAFDVRSQSLITRQTKDLDRTGQVLACKFA